MSGYIEWVYMLSGCSVWVGKEKTTEWTLTSSSSK